MLQTKPETTTIAPQDYLRNKIFGAFGKSPEASRHDIQAKIQAAFPHYEPGSLLDSILAKLPESAMASHELEVIKKFSAILSPEDFVAFTRNSARPKPAAVRGAKAENPDTTSLIMEELEPILDVFADPDTKIVCFWATGPTIDVENFAGVVHELDMETSDTLRQLLAKACRFGIPGQTIQSYELTELGYKMSYSYNGWKQVRSPCILFKRLV